MHYNEAQIKNSQPVWQICRFKQKIC